MSCLSPTARTRIQARITKLETALENAYDTLAEIALKQEESYKLDTSEGSQQLKNVDFKDLNQNILDMETLLEHLYQKLSCRGIVRLNLRRKQSRTLLWR
jgi:hypothetical protein